MNSTTNNATIYFDLDGTIADLYGFNDWLTYLQNEQTIPYSEAGLLVDGEQFRNFLAAGKAAGILFGVISWGAKNASKDYQKAIRRAKIEWLKKNNLLKYFNELHVVKYGTPKNRAAKNRTGVLVDDELQRWNVEKLVDANNFRNILNVENLWSCLFSLASE
nr:MAG TPA: acid phosphatase [Caudoviricetes sp.]